MRPGNEAWSPRSALGEAWRGAAESRLVDIVEGQDGVEGVELLELDDGEGGVGAQLAEHLCGAIVC